MHILQIFDVAEQSMGLYSRVLELERRFYTHSCSSTATPNLVPIRSSSRGITRPFRMCLGYKPKIKTPPSLTKQTNVCDELRSDLNELVEDVFINEERVGSCMWISDGKWGPRMVTVSIVFQLS